MIFYVCFYHHGAYYLWNICHADTYQTAHDDLCLRLDVHSHDHGPDHDPYDSPCVYDHLSSLFFCRAIFLHVCHRFCDNAALCSTMASNYDCFLLFANSFLRYCEMHLCCLDGMMNLDFCHVCSRRKEKTNKICD